MKETRDSLEMFFEDILMEGQPFAARVVRPEVGTQLRDDTINGIVIPLCTSKWSYHSR